MHRFLISTMAISVLILSAALAWATVEAPKELTLQPPASIKATKTFVAFPHAKHEAAKLDCKTCHHTWDSKADIMKCSSSGCHDQPGKKGENAYYTAFHFKKSDGSCLGCHKAMKKQGKNVPVACKQCHPKK
ncbi:cytochrome c3 family protein [Pseudodesulfovibrio sp. zrk46]|uniref:cytochrome c3 family protein n=1 Tax=Pseudodesulfovibrio sp. zrk46 TaxID=2725288 RepID=UPI0014490DA0|nr:cytochrome c3 family protein [Pseudodesulfovibrio sp. zrk46]QJB57529.1 cytochrome c3 family protein [Pseudodesulfovibrio sp. zrk46]